MKFADHVDGGQNYLPLPTNRYYGAVDLTDSLGSSFDSLRNSIMAVNDAWPNGVPEVGQAASGQDKYRLMTSNCLLKLAATVIRCTMMRMPIRI